MRAAQAQVTQDDVNEFTEGLPGNEFFGQNLASDQAVSALEYIFGDVINVAAGLDPNPDLSLGTPDTPFAAMIGMMNTGLLFLGAVYLAWVTLTGVLYSADKGEIFGGKWSVVWMPLKTTLGVSAIFPAVYGYSWLQFFVFWVLLQGIGLGNAVMGKGFDMFKERQEFSHVSPVDSNLVRVGYDILRSAYCAAAVNQMNDEAISATLKEVADTFTASDQPLENTRVHLFHGVSVEIQDSAGAAVTRSRARMAMRYAPATNLTKLQEAKESGPVYRTAHYYWGLEPDNAKLLVENAETGQINESVREDYCGHLTLARVVNYYIDETLEVGSKKLQRQINMRNEAGKTFGFGPNPDNRIPDREFAALDLWVRTINTIGITVATMQNPYDTMGNQKEIPNGAAVQLLIDQFVAANEAFTAERLELDSLYQDLYVSEQEKTVEDAFWKSFTDQLEADGFLSFGVYYVKLSEARANLRKRMLPHFSYEESSPNIWENFDLGMGDDNEATPEPHADGLSDSQRLSLFRYYKGFREFRQQVILSIGVKDQGDEGDWALYEGSSGYAGGPALPEERKGLFGKAFSGISEGINGLLLMIYDPLRAFLWHFTAAANLHDETGPPPLLRIREMGHGIERIAGYSLTVSAASGAASGIPIVGGAAGWVAGIGMTFTFYLAAVGGFLAHYLPMVPFLVWVGAVVGYFLLAIESVIAAPLWAISFMEPGTQDGPGGKNAQGWYLVMNLFLRPVLLVVSMIAVMLLADMVLGFLNTYMMPAFEMSSAGESAWTKLLSLIWQLGIYCVFALTTMHGVYSLIHRIPDNIMEWLGVGVRSLGDLSDEREVRGLIMGFMNRQRMIGAGSRGMRPRDRDKDPEKDDGPRVESRD